MMKKSMVLTTAVAAILSSANVLADVSVNAAATNNYIWRGVTQSTDTASVSGGLDWSDKSGLYAGVWSGSLVGGTETDLYVGFGGEAGSVGYDVGLITYQYSQAPDYNFSEAYLNLSMADFTVGVATTVDSGMGNDAEKDPTASGMFDSGDMYVSASYGFTAGKFDVSVFGGSYMFEHDSKDYSATGGATIGEIDYSHYGVSMTAGEVTIAFEKNDIKDPAEADNVRVVATWSKSWDI
ncbi:MAG: TorF family putative porin [Gammaproteobacteria bacterium]|nr:TorF family putative porin [Gammaproteobacteria bacterium]